MLKQKTILVCTASCLSLLIGYSARADIPPALSFISSQSDNPSLYSLPKDLVTSPLPEALETTNIISLPKDLGSTLSSPLPKDLGSYLSYPLPKDLGSYLSYPLPKDLGRGWGGFHNPTPIQLAAACFVTDTSACSGNEFGGNNADEDDGGVPPGGDDYDLDNAERCPKVRNLPTSAPTTALISKNASAIVPQTMSPAKTVSKAWAKPAAENMPPVATAAKVLIMSPFPTAMFRTAHFVPVATASNTKSNATPASILNAPPAAPAPVPMTTALITKNAIVRPIMNGTMFPSPASAPRFINTTASANTSPAATVKAATINMPVANAKPAMSGMTHKANA